MINLKTQPSKRGFLVAGILAASGWSGAGFAQEKASGNASLMEEVIVTAQKRAENVQDVGMAISALSGEALEQLGMVQGFQVADQVPNFNYNSAGGDTSPVQYLNIRGVQIVDFSLANDSSVSVYVDEIYQPSQGAALSQVYDVERVEVLRGPQGTLFGRNTTGGLVHFVSKRPTAEPEGYLELGYGKAAKTTAQGAVSGPFSDSVRGRVAFKTTNQDGWQTEQRTGRDDFGELDAWAIKGSLEADLSENALAILRVHAEDSDGIAPARGFYGSLSPVDGSRCSQADALASLCVNRAGLRDPNPDPEHVYADIARKNLSKASGANLNITWDLDWAEFVSVTGVEKFEGEHGGQFAPPGNVMIGFIWGGDAEGFNQEFRLSGETGAGGNWVAGVYYYEDEKNSYSNTIVNMNPFIPLNRTTSTDSFGVFGQTEIPLSNEVDLIVGGRYTSEQRALDSMDSNGADIDVSSVDDIDEGEFTGKLGLEWRPSDELLTYASFSSGYKSGGYNPTTTDLGQVGPVDSEKLDALELGWKATLADGAMKFNGAVFYYDFQGYQSVVTTTRTVGVDEYIVETKFLNAGDADIYGAELELSWLPTDNLYLSLGLGTLSTEIKSDETVTISNVPINGNELPNSPSYSVNGVVRYSIPMDSGTFSVQTDFRYQDDIYHNIDNIEFETQDAYGVYNIRAFWESADGHWDLQAFIENVSDEHFTLQSVYSTTLGAAQRSWGMPQWWGLKAKYMY